MTVRLTNLTRTILLDIKGDFLISIPVAGWSIFKMLLGTVIRKNVGAILMILQNTRRYESA